MKKLLSISLLFLFVLALGCKKDQQTDRSNTTTATSSEPLFTLLPSSQTGIDFRNDLEEDVSDETKNILSFDYFFNGAGVAIGDINKDGLPDVFMSGNEVPNRLYLNKGNMQFEDITEKAGINVNKNWATGVTMADVNGDSHLDIYVCQGGSKLTPWEDKANLLYINNGDMTFTEKAAALGLNDSNIGTQAAFFDYDKDGDLDCFVLNESKYTLVAHATIFKELEVKENMLRASSHLYRNDGGKYKQVTESAGVLEYGFGLGLAISDLNRDGWPDIYVANDYSVPDFLWINNGDGTFTDKAKEMTNHLSFYSMGIDIADINNDGQFDIGVVDMAADDHIRAKTLMVSMDIPTFWYYINDRDYHYQYMFNAMQLNNGNNTFSNVANMVGVASTDWSWSSLFADFDNDGYKDYFVSNGFRRYARDNDFRIAMEKRRTEVGGSIPLDERQKFYDMMPTIKLSNKMYHNDQKLHFKSVEKNWGLDQPSFSSGAAYADLDMDGDLDLIVNNVAMEAFVYQNNATTINKNHYLRLQLKGKDSATPITNTLVEIFYKDQQQILELMNTRGYESAVEEVLHFGLGKEDKVDRIEITWPNGKVQTLNDVKADQQLVVVQNEAESKVAAKKSKPNFVLNPVDAKTLGIDFSHVENEYDDFAKEILLPQKQSTHGPCIAVADVNGDGLDDFYVGGAANSNGVLYIQNQDGTFGYNPDHQIWAFDKESEDVGALFFDADGNGLLDLYVVSGGGGEFAPGAKELRDRLYINTGNGKFSKAPQALPQAFAAGSCVKAADYDGDGDMDLFVGGRAVPGKYPYPSRSYILKFDNFKYSDVTAEVAPTLMQPGLVTDAVWTDFNNDSTMDLIIVGEWMAPSFYQNNGGKFDDVTESKGNPEMKGWWYSIETADVDNDGDLDLICGNLGTNAKFKASYKKPFNVFATDFDQNGTYDIVLSKEYKGKMVPTRGRQCSSEQMPFIKDKFPTYKEFATAGIDDILGKDKMKEALNLTVTDFESKVLINNGDGTYSAKALPRLAQAAPLNGIIVKDINKDGNLDLISAGNMYNTEVETPRYDAGTGLIMMGDGKGNFEAIPSGTSGFFADKDVKDIALLRTKGKDLVLVANNGEALEVFQF
ncbi:MAG: hypothetical protein ACI9VN_003215 [Patescibacteria group bacterium]|jgi:hypothetical protein